MFEIAKKRILLIEPPYFRLYKDTYSLDRAPHGLLCLAGAIFRDTDWEVFVYNADFNGIGEIHRVRYQTGPGFRSFLHELTNEDGPIWQEVRATIAGIRPDVVGITAKSPNFKSACRVAAIAKEIDKNAVVVLGGPHSTLVGREVLDVDEIDIACQGEGELVIVELLRRIESKKDYRGIQRICYRGSSEVAVEDRIDVFCDLDAYPRNYFVAEKSLIDFNKYPISAFRNVYTSRGCPYDCFFCASKKLWGNRVRLRSYESVIDEIALLNEKGLKHVQFQDDTFGADHEYLSALLDGLDKVGLKIHWNCFTHVNSLNQRILSRMKRSGCRSVNVGIESGNDEILKLIRKRFGVEKALGACALIREEGMQVGAFFQIGFPHETEESLSDTVSAMRIVKAFRLIYSIFTPHPGTEAYEFCREKGLIDTFDPSLYNHQSPENCFCLNIRHERFRVLASKIERMVDRRNFISRAGDLTSLSGIARFRELGIREGLRMAGRSIFNG